MRKLRVGYNSSVCLEAIAFNLSINASILHFWSVRFVLILLQLYVQKHAKRYTGQFTSPVFQGNCW